jgi:SPP1 gp7 family putative phage head morphogenesis protein
VAKAGFLGLRKGVDQRVVPAMRDAMQAFLARQREDIVSRLRSATERELANPQHWWRGDTWDKALAKTLKPHIAGIANVVTARTAEILVTGKAKRKAPKEVVAAVEGTELDPFIATVERTVLASTASRIGGINDTTRLAVQGIIRDGIGQGLTSQEIAALVEQLPAFDAARAELVARTESMFAYNTSALTSYGEFGVEEVQAIDGDQDEVCADRDGKVFSVDDAADIEDHPNGTLDWAPYYAPAKAVDPMLALMASMRQQATRTVLERDETGSVMAYRSENYEPGMRRMRIEHPNGAVTFIEEEAV